MKSKKILMVAGEASGDLHGAHLMESIHRIDPEIQFYGVGGEHLERKGNRLTGYCEDVARSFHRFYHERRVVQEDAELGLARLALCHATRRVLASALALMSIEAPRSM